MKKRNRVTFSLLGALAALVTVVPLNAKEVDVQKMADAIFSVIEADRATYTLKVVQRLQNEDEVIIADEHWKEESALPLPAQMLRMGAERVNEKNAGFSYALLSLWPINKQNAPRTELEKKALTLINQTKQNFYGEEKLGDINYYTAVYPDIAVSEACVSCHNDHQDSQKKDFKKGEAMGAIVIRIPLQN